MEHSNPVDPYTELNGSINITNITQISVNNVQIRWSSEILNCLGFELERKENNDFQTIAWLSTNTFSYTDSAAAPFKNYIYRLKAYNTNYEKYSSENSINTLFSAPSSLTFEKKSIHEIELSWNDNTEYEDKYVIDRKLNNEDWNTGYAEVNAGITQFTDENANPNDTVRYRVYGVSGEFSTNSIETENIENIFPAPYNENYIRESVNQIKIMWAYNYEGENGFKIAKKVDNGEWNWNFGQVNENIHEFTDSAAEINETIKYSVYAFYADENSSPAELLIDNTLPEPEAVTGEFNEDNSTISLNWTIPFSGIDYFTIEKSKNGSAYSAAAENISGSSRSWTDSDIEVTNWNKYVYRIKSITDTYTSEFGYSNEVSIVLQNFPGPEGLTANSQSIHAVKLDWNYPYDYEEGFYIAKRVDNGNWNWQYAQVSENIHTYTDENAEPNKNIKYGVYAYYGNYYSNSDDIEIDNAFPGIGEGDLNIERNGVSKLKLSWDYNYTGQDGFRVAKRVEQDDWNWTYGITTSDSRVFTDNNAEINKNITYAVFAYYGNEVSASENIAFYNVFPSPANFDYERIALNEIKLLWDYDFSYHQGFKIAKKVDGVWNWVYTTLDPNIHQYIDLYAESGKIIKYAVYAYSDTLNSLSADLEINNIVPNVNSLSGEYNSEMNKIELSWSVEDISGITSFTLERSKNSGNYSVLSSSISGSASSYIDSNIDNSNWNKYTYRIKAHVDDYESDYTYSAEILAEIESFPPPENLSYSSQAINIIKLSWQYPYAYEQGFKIAKKINDNDWDWNFASVNANVYSYIDYNAEVNDTIRYAVFAYYEDVNSPSVNVTVENNMPAPSNLTLSRVKITEVDLNWNYYYDGETGFRIAKRVDGVWDWNFGNVTYNTLTFTDTYAQPDKTIKYAVFAYYNDSITGETEVSPSVDIELYNSFPAPYNFSGTYQSASDRIKLEWSCEEIEEGLYFRIERSINGSGYSLLDGNIEGNLRIFYDTNITDGNNYSYRLKSYGSGYESVYVYSASITP